MLARSNVAAEREHSDEELGRPAAVLAQRFIQRWDVYPQQLDDGRYICVHEPLNVSHLYAHLRGEITLRYISVSIVKAKYVSSYWTMTRKRAGNIS